jgi:hypothetical protein
MALMRKRLSFYGHQNIDGIIEADLERTFEWLQWYPNLKRLKKGKSLIFYWKLLTATEIEAYNQRVAEEIRAARDENGLYLKAKVAAYGLINRGEEKSPLWTIDFLSSMDYIDAISKGG